MWLFIAFWKEKILKFLLNNSTYFEIIGPHLRTSKLNIRGERLLEDIWYWSNRLTCFFLVNQGLLFFYKKACYFNFHHKLNSIIYLQYYIIT